MSKLTSVIHCTKTHTNISHKFCPLISISLTVLHKPKVRVSLEYLALLSICTSFSLKQKSCNLDAHYNPALKLRIMLTCFIAFYIFFILYCFQKSHCLYQTHALTLRISTEVIILLIERMFYVLKALLLLQGVQDMQC